jgi:hypothetical protein
MRTLHKVGYKDIHLLLMRFEVKLAKILFNDFFVKKK